MALLVTTSCAEEDPGHDFTGSTESEPPTATARKVSAANYFGLYQIHLMEGDSLFDWLPDSASPGEKLILSFASLFKMQVRVQENGYLKFQGAYGRLQWGNNPDMDSMRYWVENNRFYMDSLDVNGQNSIPVTFAEEGIYLKADSLHLFLKPIDQEIQ